MVRTLRPAAKPWVIAKLGKSDEKSRIIRRYANRQDADDDLRLLSPAISAVGQFVVAFDLVKTDEGSILS